MRDENWNRLLSEYIAERRTQPHVWGANDCASFAADAGIAMGCPDLLAGLRDYDDALSAGRVLEAAGYADLAEMVHDRLAQIETPFAQRGDIALIRNEGHDGVYAWTLALYDGPQLIGPGERKMIRLPRYTAAKAYRLG
jgi:hypothetical protein